MKKIVCLWGGPGTGKSTACAGLFRKLKVLGYNVEMNREYVKDWVWEGREIIPGDQIYITAKQTRKEIIYMRKQVEVVITDSPLALTTFYGDIYDKYEKEGGACKAIVKQHHMICKDLGYKIEHFFLVRTKPYSPHGRFQDEQTAKEYDVKIRNFLDSYPINYKMVLADEDVEDTIVKHLLDSK